MEFTVQFSFFEPFRRKESMHCVGRQLRQADLLTAGRGPFGLNFLAR